MKKILFTLFIINSVFSFSQNDSLFIRSIYDKALADGKSYEDLRSLCKDVGARLSGSAEAEMAIQWGYNKLNGYDFDTVYFQEIKVPHWERGTTESAWIVDANNTIKKIKV